MDPILPVIFFSLIGGVFSLFGGVLLMANSKIANSLADYATPFAAGALLSAAFIDILPEAAHEGDIRQALLFTIVGILTFFVLERFIRWFHHHRCNAKTHNDPKVPLVIIGDSIHNFIDGIAIASGFLISPSTGIVVTLAVAAHEIPQEIGDFGLLLHKGVSRKKVLLINILSALATTISAVLFFTIGQTIELPMEAILGMVAGFFIYIAVSDIIPDIHKKEDKILAGPQTALLIVGVIIVGFATTYLHQFIDQGIDLVDETSITEDIQQDSHDHHE